MTTQLGTIGLLCVLSGCGSSSSEPDRAELNEVSLRNASSAIVGGTADLNDEAVVALTHGGAPHCTATMVTSRYALTAAHCIHPDKAPPIENFEIFFGENVDLDGVFIPVTEGAMHPLYQLGNPWPHYDIAVVRLAQTAPVAPIPVATTPFDDDFVQQQVRLVGFGRTSMDSSDSGQKREGSASITAYASFLFYLHAQPALTCLGDSGGPALLLKNGREVVAGVHSQSDCVSHATEVRVDAHVASFLAPYLEPEPGCHADELCASDCPAVDPDCPCAADGFCADGCFDAALDPDCLQLCGPEGSCMPQGCPSSDPDCDQTESDCGPPGKEDGFCDDDCADDPDCAVDEHPTAATARYPKQPGACSLSLSNNDASLSLPLLVSVMFLGLLRRRQ